MSEEGAPHTLSLAHAETQTHSSAGSTHTGGPMQLQASTDTEENRVSTLTLGAYRCLFCCCFVFFVFTQPCLSPGTTQKLCRT